MTDTGQASLAAPVEMHLYSDGSTNVNCNTVGAAAVHENRVEVCSYILFITGAETSEHLGLACSLNLIMKWLDERSASDSGGLRCVLHGDNVQAWGRYKEAAPLPSGECGYLQGLVVLNKERLQRLLRHPQAPRPRLRLPKKRPQTQSSWRT